MPEPVGPKALLIDKIPSLLHVGDLGYPVALKTFKGGYLIGDDLTGIHLPGLQGRSDFETHAGRGDIRQVTRFRQKVPQMLTRGRKGLLCYQRIHPRMSIKSYHFSPVAYPRCNHFRIRTTTRRILFKPCISKLLFNFENHQQSQF